MKIWLVVRGEALIRKKDNREQQWWETEGLMKRGLLLRRDTDNKEEILHVERIWSDDMLRKGKWKDTNKEEIREKVK